MRKLFIILAVLFMTGIANAAGIPTGADPLNAPEVWTQEVYNNSGSAISSGNVVVWDMSSDTADTSYAFRTGWITTTTTADDINVAGVVIDDSIASSSVGTIAIYGPVYTLCLDSSDAVTLDTAVGTGGTAGQCGDAAAGNDSGILGWAIQSGPVATTLGGYGGTAGHNYIMIPVFVKPTPMVN